MDASLALLPAVERLDLSSNNIATVQNLTACAALAELDLSNNRVISLAQVGLCAGALRRLVLQVRTCLHMSAHAGKTQRKGWQYHRVGHHGLDWVTAACQHMLARHSTMQKQGCQYHRDGCQHMLARHRAVRVQGCKYHRVGHHELDWVMVGCTYSRHDVLTMPRKGGQMYAM